MAARRPYWNGYLMLSLVNIAVELHSATTSGHHIRLNMIHQPSGKRIRYQKVAEGMGPAVCRAEACRAYAAFRLQAGA